jgi:hypothetical protein
VGETARRAGERMTTRGSNMRHLLKPALAAIAIGIVSSAHAQPSFNCNVQLNPTEQAICDHADLADLDQEMAGKFRAIFDRLSGGQRDTFRREQSQWRRDRDACGPVVGCIHANYFYRISQFDGMAGMAQPGAGGPTRAANARVLADGTIERIMPDGERILYFTNGQEEHHLPNGDVFMRNIQAMQIPILTPPLDQYGRWVDGLSSNLLNILHNMLSDQEYSAYQSTEAGRDEYSLIDWRLRFISRLTAQ